MGTGPIYVLDALHTFKHHQGVISVRAGNLISLSLLRWSLGLIHAPKLINISSLCISPS
jgi:hypothetical protein